MKPLTELIAEIQTRANNASAIYKVEQLRRNPDGPPTREVFMDGFMANLKPNDAKFIAAARTDIPRLLKALETAIQQRNECMSKSGLALKVIQDRNSELVKILTGDES